MTERIDPMPRWRLQAERAFTTSTGLRITPAVVETVLLAVAGLENAEIAARRGCRPKTVAGYLNQFYEAARATIVDDGFWADIEVHDQRPRIAEIWARMAPYLAHLVPQGAQLPVAEVPAAALAELPGSRCRTLWGRAALVDDVCDRLRRPDGGRVVLLVAFGGYGKTECARAVAETLLRERRFRELVWLDLEPETHDGGGGTRATLPGASRALLTRLGCASEEELRRRLRGEPVLVVVDRLESLVAHEREAFVERLRGWLGSGLSRALLASRVDVHLLGIERPAFAGLDLAAATAMLRGEAAALPRGSELAHASDATIERIWQLTLGMPLALQRTLAQSEHWELAQVIELLERAYGFGVGDEYYATLCLPAWRDLIPPARALLVYLALATRAPQTSAQLGDIALAPGPTFEGDTLRRALEQLIDWRLVDRALPPGPDGEPTYTLHPIYRAFVASSAIREDWTTRLLLNERVVMEAATRVHERLIALTIGQLEGDVGRYMTLFSQTVHDRTLARAIPDMLHVMRAQLRLGNLTRVLWYWEAISGYLWYFGRIQEFAECDEAALDAARRLVARDASADRRVPGIIAAELGYASLELDEPRRAAEWLREAERVFRAIGELPELVRVLRYQATLRLQERDYGEAERLCRAGLALLPDLRWEGVRVNPADERAIISSPLHDLLGAIWSRQGRHAEARRATARARHIARRISRDHRYWSLPPSIDLGRIHLACGRLALADRYFRHCLAETEDGSSPKVRADAFAGLAALASANGEQARAAEHAREAARLYESMGKRADAARVLVYVASDTP